jgi:hypothetical protein
MCSKIRIVIWAEDRLDSYLDAYRFRGQKIGLLVLDGERNLCIQHAFVCVYDRDEEAVPLRSSTSATVRMFKSLSLSSIRQRIGR